MDQLKANEPKRVELYKSVGSAGQGLRRAGKRHGRGWLLCRPKLVAIKDEIAHYVAVRDEVKLGAKENIDFKQFEAGMRFLLDTYIQAGASEVVAQFEDTGLVDLIVNRGAGAIDELPAGIKKDPEAVAETIINNIRKVIIDERALNPKYYDTMSSLLDALIEQRRQEALDYKRYLEELLALATKIGKKESDTVYPAWAHNGAQKALVDFGFDRCRDCPPDRQCRHGEQAA